MSKGLNVNPTQCERVDWWLRNRGKLDQATALKELGIARLASRISEMNKRGAGIKREMRKGRDRWGGSFTYAVYYLPTKEGGNSGSI